MSDSDLEVIYDSELDVDTSSQGPAPDQTKQRILQLDHRTLVTEHLAVLKELKTYKDEARRLNDDLIQKTKLETDLRILIQNLKLRLDVVSGSSQGQGPVKVKHEQPLLNPEKGAQLECYGNDKSKSPRYGEKNVKVERDGHGDDKNNDTNEPLIGQGQTRSANIEMEPIDEILVDRLTSEKNKEIKQLDSYLTDIDGEEENERVRQSRYHSQPRTSSSINKHHVTNNTPKPILGKALQCGECNRTFSTQGHLNQHLKVHTKKQIRLECKQCQMKFKFNSQWELTEHFRKHTKPFKCPECQVGFSRKSELDRHFRIHTGEKTHFCQKCCIGFTRKYIYESHLQSKSHNTNNYRCEYCFKWFTMKTTLKAHFCSHTPK